MSKKLSVWEKELSELQTKRRDALEPARKKFRAAEESVKDQYDKSIAELEAKIKDEKDKRTHAWCVVFASAKLDDYERERAHRILSVYSSKEDAERNKPESNHHHAYDVLKIKRDQTVTENTQKIPFDPW